MSLNFRQVQEQVKRLGENAPVREEKLHLLREQARQLLNEQAHNLEAIRQKVKRVAEQDSSLRCALPPNQEIAVEALNGRFPLPALPTQATILAADGSQIALDYHAEVEYCLINVGAIRLRLGCSQPPDTIILSRLLYEEELQTPTGMITDATLALRRDKEERTLLASLSENAEPPVITFTDGPMELWGSKDGGEETSEFQKHLQEYLLALSKLQTQGAVAAGYVDKPAANLVVRLLEVVKAEDAILPDFRKYHPLRGVTDFDLYAPLLKVGERSAVFALQSQSARQYRGGLALHFFYLNVGREGHSWLARVEIPGWVAAQTDKLEALHAVLYEQCRLMGARPYPYLLHRAHEAAVVSLEERDQVTQMIVQELRRRGVAVGEKSYKQANKELEGRTRYK